MRLLAFSVPLSGYDIGRGFREPTALTRSASVLFQCGELLWEKRHYEKGHWACVTMREDTYEKSICYGFMKLMRYICEQNSLGKYTSSPPFIIIQKKGILGRPDIFCSLHICR